MEKFVSFFTGIVELQMHENGVFFTPVIHTLICCVHRFLESRDTLPCV